MEIPELALQTSHVQLTYILFLFLAETCNPSEFKCDGHKCLSNGKRCDGKVDCSDYTDEKNCRKFLVDHFVLLHVTVVLIKV